MAYVISDLSKFSEVAKEFESIVKFNFSNKQEVSQFHNVFDINGDKNNIVTLQSNIIVHLLRELCNIPLNDLVYNYSSILKLSYILTLLIRESPDEVIRLTSGEVLTNWDCYFEENKWKLFPTNYKRVDKYEKILYDMIHEPISLVLYHKDDIKIVVDILNIIFHAAGHHYKLTCDTSELDLVADSVPEHIPKVVQKGDSVPLALKLLKLYISLFSELVRSKETNFIPLTKGDVKSDAELAIRYCNKLLTLLSSSFVDSKVKKLMVKYSGINQFTRIITLYITLILRGIPMTNISSIILLSIKSLLIYNAARNNTIELDANTPKFTTYIFEDDHMSAFSCELAIQPTEEEVRTKSNFLLFDGMYTLCNACATIFNIFSPVIKLVILQYDIIGSNSVAVTAGQFRSSQFSNSLVKYIINYQVKQKQKPIKDTGEIPPFLPHSLFHRWIKLDYPLFPILGNIIAGDPFLNYVKIVVVSKNSVLSSTLNNLHTCWAVFPDDFDFGVDVWCLLKCTPCLQSGVLTSHIDCEKKEYHSKVIYKPSVKIEFLNDTLDKKYWTTKRTLYSQVGLSSLVVADNWEDNFSSISEYANIIRDIALITKILQYIRDSATFPIPVIQLRAVQLKASKTIIEMLIDKPYLYKMGFTDYICLTLGACCNTVFNTACDIVLTHNKYNKFEESNRIYNLSVSGKTGFFANLSYDHTELFQSTSCYDISLINGRLQLCHSNLSRVNSLVQYAVSCLLAISIFKICSRELDDLSLAVTYLSELPLTIWQDKHVHPNGDPISYYSQVDDTMIVEDMIEKQDVAQFRLYDIIDTANICKGKVGSSWGEYVTNLFKNKNILWEGYGNLLVKIDPSSRARWLNDKYLHTVLDTLRGSTDESSLMFSKSRTKQDASTVDHVSSLDDLNNMDIVQALEYEKNYNDEVEHFIPLLWILQSFASTDHYYSALFSKFNDFILSADNSSGSDDAVTIVDPLASVNGSLLTSDVDYQLLIERIYINRYNSVYMMNVADDSCTLDLPQYDQLILGLAVGMPLEDVVFKEQKNGKLLNSDKVTSYFKDKYDNISFWSTLNLYADDILVSNLFDLLFLSKNPNLHIKDGYILHLVDGISHSSLECNKKNIDAIKSKLNSDLKNILHTGSCRIGAEYNYSAIWSCVLKSVQQVIASESQASCLKELKLDARNLYEAVYDNVNVGFLVLYSLGILERRRRKATLGSDIYTGISKVVNNLGISRTFKGRFDMSIIEQGKSVDVLQGVHNSVYQAISVVVGMFSAVILLIANSDENVELVNLVSDINKQLGDKILSYEKLVDIVTSTLKTITSESYVGNFLSLDDFISIMSISIRATLYIVRKHNKSLSNDICGIDARYAALTVHVVLSNLSVMITDVMNLNLAYDENFASHNIDALSMDRMLFVYDVCSHVFTDWSASFRRKSVSANAESIELKSFYKCHRNDRHAKLCYCTDIIKYPFIGYLDTILSILKRNSYLLVLPSNSQTTNDGEIYNLTQYCCNQVSKLPFTLNASISHQSPSGSSAKRGSKDITNIGFITTKLLFSNISLLSPFGIIQDAKCSLTQTYDVVKNLHSPISTYKFSDMYIDSFLRWKSTVDNNPKLLSSYYSKVSGTPVSEELPWCTKQDVCRTKVEVTLTIDDEWGSDDPLSASSLTWYYNTYSEHEPVKVENVNLKSINFIINLEDYVADLVPSDLPTEYAESESYNECYKTISSVAALIARLIILHLDADFDRNKLTPDFCLNFLLSLQSVTQNRLSLKIDVGTHSIIKLPLLSGLMCLSIVVHTSKFAGEENNNIVYINLLSALTQSYKVDLICNRRSYFNQTHLCSKIPAIQLGMWKAFNDSLAKLLGTKVKVVYPRNMDKEVRTMVETSGLGGSTLIGDPKKVSLIQTQLRSHNLSSQVSHKHLLNIDLVDNVHSDVIDSKAIYESASSDGSISAGEVYNLDKIFSTYNSIFSFGNESVKAIFGIDSAQHFFDIIDAESCKYLYSIIKTDIVISQFVTAVGKYVLLDMLSDTNIAKSNVVKEVGNNLNFEIYDDYQSTLPIATFSMSGEISEEQVLIDNVITDNHVLNYSSSSRDQQDDKFVGEFGISHRFTDVESSITYIVEMCRMFLQSVNLWNYSNNIYPLSSNKALCINAFEYVNDNSEVVSMYNRNGTSHNQNIIDWVKLICSCLCSDSTDKSLISINCKVINYYQCDAEDSRYHLGSSDKNWYLYNPINRKVNTSDGKSLKAKRIPTALLLCDNQNKNFMSKFNILDVFSCVSSLINNCFSGPQIDGINYYQTMNLRNLQDYMNKWTNKKITTEYKIYQYARTKCQALWKSLHYLTVDSLAMLVYNLSSCIITYTPEYHKLSQYEIEGVQHYLSLKPMLRLPEVSTAVYKVAYSSLSSNKIEYKLMEPFDIYVYAWLLVSIPKLVLNYTSRGPMVDLIDSITRANAEVKFENQTSETSASEDYEYNDASSESSNDTGNTDESNGTEIASEDSYSHLGSGNNSSVESSIVNGVQDTAMNVELENDQSIASFILKNSRNNSAINIVTNFYDAYVPMRTFNNWQKLKCVPFSNEDFAVIELPHPHILIPNASGLVGMVRCVLRLSQQKCAILKYGAFNIEWAIIGDMEVEITDSNTGQHGIMSSMEWFLSLIDPREDLHLYSDEIHAYVKFDVTPDGIYENVIPLILDCVGSELKIALGDLTYNDMLKVIFNTNNDLYNFNGWIEDYNNFVSKKISQFGGAKVDMRQSRDIIGKTEVMQFLVDYVLYYTLDLVNSVYENEVSPSEDRALRHNRVMSTLVYKHQWILALAHFDITYTKIVEFETLFESISKARSKDERSGEEPLVEFNLLEKSCCAIQNLIANLRNLLISCGSSLLVGAKLRETETYKNFDVRGCAILDIWLSSYNTVTSRLLFFTIYHTVIHVLDVYFNSKECSNILHSCSANNFLE